MSATICTVGTWHLASVTSACLAEMGNTVRGVGADADAIQALNRGEPPVSEPRLRAILRRNLSSGALGYSTDYEQALRSADIAIIAIDTPVDDDDVLDLSGVLEAAVNIANAASGDLTISISSQVPVGTCERIQRIVSRENPRHTFTVIYNPEFLRLGNAVRLFFKPDRIVIGAPNEEASEPIARLYASLRRPIVRTDLRTAEMIKHASNAFLATSISYINEIANLCEQTGADVVQVSQAMRLDRRIGKHAFIEAGLGFAGGTLARDVVALQQLGEKHRIGTPVLDGALEVNRSRSDVVMRRLKGHFDSLAGLQIGVLGVTYKAGTNTLRRSIAIGIMQELLDGGATVKVFDPSTSAEIGQIIPEAQICGEVGAVFERSDAVVLMTPWPEFKDLDLKRLGQSMRSPVLIDTANLYDPSTMPGLGLTYYGIGRNAPTGDGA